MDANPWRDATKADVELGNVAFLTPCPSKRRRTVAESPTQQTCPTWAENSAEAIQRPMLFREENGFPAILHPRKMISEEGGPLVKNQYWSDANPDGPLRKIVSELCGVGRAAVGKYLKEHRGGGGVLRSALPRGPVKKRPARSGHAIQNAGGRDFVRLYRRSDFLCTQERPSEHGAQLAPISRSRRSRAESPWRIRTRFPEKASADGAFFREDKEGANRREVEAVYK